MLRRLLFVMVLGAVLSIAPLALAKGKKRTHKVNATINAAQVAQEGSTGVLAGTFSDPGLGSGAVVYRAGGGTTPGTVTFTVFLAKGTLRGNATDTVTPNATGVSISGTGRAAGGTGPYKGAAGNVTFSGSSGSDHIVHLSIKGTLRY
jgi:hypothetical protein